MYVKILNEKWFIFSYFVMFQEVMDVDDHLPHTTEVVVEAAEIIVLDHDLIHPVSRNIIC